MRQLIVQTGRSKPGAKGKLSPDQIRIKVMSSDIMPRQDRIKRLQSSLSAMDRMLGDKSQRTRQVNREVEKLGRQIGKITEAMNATIIAMSKRKK